MATPNNNIQAERPDPIISDIEVIPFKKRMDPQEAVDALLLGHYVLIVDFYSSGLLVLRAIKDFLRNTKPDQSYDAQHTTRSLFRELSHRLLLLIRGHRIIVRKAPQIGWFKILYPELDEFLLPFPKVQGLNSSWQWYEKGIDIPVLKQKIHPYFGTYFPTRYEHLKLFDRWLKQYDGEKKSAIDIGVGCGVLSFQMLNDGFEKIAGTDTNPNAIIGLSEDLYKNEMHSRMDLFQGDLFADCKSKTELIVFNPPWIPAPHTLEGIDKAIYYRDDLFPRFFKESQNHLESNGRVVLLFSNLAEITNSSSSHPIIAELETGGRFQKELFWTKKVKAASKKTRRDQHWRESELVELWVLKQK